MAAKKTVKKTQTKVKKKTWVTILAPKIFGEKEVGETNIEEPRKALGKIVTINLMTLLKDPKKQGINISFKVTTQHDDHVGSVFYKYQIMPSSIKRMVRRNKDRIDHTFKCKTKDGYILIVKPIVLTMNKTNKSVIKQLRKKVVSYIYYLAAKKSFDEFVLELINTKLQHGLRSSLNKLYPIAICDMKVVSVAEYPQDSIKAGKKKKAEDKIEIPEEPKEKKKEEEVKEDAKAQD